ncbi:STAS domain-containing protein [Streptomyces sp. NBC_01334]|uniref:STAS domain-containing protein n=1 Tax=Streptomyces sp. NBC_01334 TaxID=2903827 RepID=UPI002E135E7A|nr:STAS domain-containing protein [Streptomyces sp. NBC_01334]
MLLPQLPHLPQLTVYRHDRRKRTLITLSGEIDFDSAPLLCASLEQCLREGVHTIDVDLTSVRFCDCSGLNAFLRAAQRTTLVGGIMRLHHPPPMLARLLDLTGCGFLLLGPPSGPLPSHPGCAPAVPAPAAPHGSVPTAPVLSGDVR